MLRGEATNTNLNVFGLTRQGFQPMTFRTQGKHANSYTTEAVEKSLTNIYGRGMEDACGNKSNCRIYGRVYRKILDSYCLLMKYADDRLN